MGDSSDNVPGVPKVGEKTAISLIRDYGSLDGVYEHIDEIKKPALHRNLAENEDKARMSLFLVTIKTDCDVELDFEKAPRRRLLCPRSFRTVHRTRLQNLLPALNGMSSRRRRGFCDPHDRCHVGSVRNCGTSLLASIRTRKMTCVIGIWLCVTARVAE